MFTPYDWQEGIGNRASYIEGKLAQGAPVLAVSLPEGILVFTYRRQARKIYEIYDRLIFAGIGQQSDVEAIRTAAIEFTHQEGYNRSEADVTIQRVATALSAPLKKAFADFGASPVVARTLFAEVNETPEEDFYYTLDYDGDYAVSRRFAAIAGTTDAIELLRNRLESFDLSGSATDAIESLKEIWAVAADPDAKPLEEATEGMTVEAVLLERSNAREDRFRVLMREEF